MVPSVADFTAYDHLDVPVLISRSRKIVYANDALLRTMGVPRERLIGYVMGSDPLRTRLVAPGELGTALQLMDTMEQGGQAPRDWWVEIPLPGGTARTCVRAMRGREPGEFIFMLLDVPGLAEAREFSEAMIQTAQELLRGRTEGEVLRRAIAFLAHHRLLATVLYLTEDGIVHGPMHQNMDDVASAVRFYGKPIEQVVFPRTSLPHLEESLRTRRAKFHADIFTIVRSMHSKEMADFIESRSPHMPALDAPIFVEDAPYGVLAVMGPSLTPSMAISLELFVQLVGSAIERARHLERAEGRLAELQHLQRELVERERLATLGQASAVVAHEVRNPLGAIINAVAVLHRDRELRGDSAQVVRVIEEEAHRLDRLVSDLLVFARPMMARPVNCALRDVANRAVAPLRLERDDVTIELDLPENADPVRADPDLLVLAVQNLVRNALQISPREGKVRLTCGVEAEQIRIAVHDQGPGVTEAEAGKIFAPFFTTRATGTGLGLAVVSRVAQAHQGRVTVSASPLGGALFMMELPKLPGDQPPNLPRQ